MSIDSILQCNKALDFHPRRPWPHALPAFSWRGERLCAFERGEGVVVDLWETNRSEWLESFIACHPELALGELARLHRCLVSAHPEWGDDFRALLFSNYGFRWSARLKKTLEILATLDFEIQNQLDEKKIGARELAPLLALTDVNKIEPVLKELATKSFTHSQTAFALELIVDLYLMGTSVVELLPEEKPEAYLKRLLRMRKPRASIDDANWREEVRQWPWPAHVQGQWQRFGDQPGLEIKIRALSPDDLQKKLERLAQIHEKWSSCPN